MAAACVTCRNGLAHALANDVAAATANRAGTPDWLRLGGRARGRSLNTIRRPNAEPAHHPDWLTLGPAFDDGRCNVLLQSLAREKR